VFLLYEFLRPLPIGGSTDFVPMFSCLTPRDNPSIEIEVCGSDKSYVRVVCLLSSAVVHTEASNK
jgi:hypothetical protein